jgi:Family of unknown function (DUF5677)
VVNDDGMHSDSAEQESLTLVEDFVGEVAYALDSLGDKKTKGLFDNYRFCSSKHLHRAADGFAFLRGSGRVDASKFLIRPAIEIAFRLEAVRKHPNLLYRIAFSEHLREKQLVQAAVEHGQTNPTITRGVEQKWKQFGDAFAAEFPEIPKVEERLTIECAAEKAGMKYVYDGHYRIYSQYTHGALFASIGYLDEATDREDNRAMAVCALIALDNLVSLGAKSPKRGSLFQRLSELPPSPPLT